jgi:hypothetical protein
MYWLFCPGLEQKFVEARVVVGSEVLENGSLVQ